MVIDESGKIFDDRRKKKVKVDADRRKCSKTKKQTKANKG